VSALFSLLCSFGSLLGSLFSLWDALDLILEPKDRKIEEKTQKTPENVTKMRDKKRERERTAEIAPARAGSSGKHFCDVEN